MLTLDPPVASAWLHRRHRDDRWSARASLDAECPWLPDVQLWALLERDLVAHCRRLDPVLQQLRVFAKALHERDGDAASGHAARLREDGAAVRELLIASYLQDPEHLGTQRALGLLCLALGRLGEGRFHLLRAIPGQYQLFAVGPRIAELRAHPAAPQQVLLVAAALEWCGDAEHARELLAALRRQLDVLRMAARCTGFPDHVLWRHPELLVHVRGVLQVGANVGDEMPCWGALGIGKLVAFEPVPAAFAVLQGAMQKHRPAQASWFGEPIAVGERVGTLPFWLGEQTGNSSFLELHPERSAYHRQNRHARCIEVKTTTLDAFAAAHPERVADCNLLFMDVQGTEHLVLAGARAMLAHIDFVVLEMSDTEIYAGSWTAPRMDALLRELGFVEFDRARGCFPEQFDAIYVRPR